MSDADNGLIKAAFGKLRKALSLRSHMRAHKERLNRKAWVRKWELFSRMPIRTVLDIGAHCGEFSAMIHQVLPTAQIFAFEPLPDCYEEVVKLAATLPGMQTFNTALGQATGEVAMNRSEFTQSSSLLPMGELHRSSFPFTARTTAQTVRVARLDDVLAGKNLETEILVNIDTQGYETEVLRGGSEVISRARFVVIESSCYELYDGEPLFAEDYDLMRELGFVYRGNLDQIISPVDGRILQIDAFFERATK